MNDHEHDWQESPLVIYVATKWDGINYRAVFGSVCSVCGVVRVDPALAGHRYYDDVNAPLTANRDAP